MGDVKKEKKTASVFLFFSSKYLDIKFVGATYIDEHLPFFSSSFSMTYMDSAQGILLSSRIAGHRNVFKIAFSRHA